MRYYGRSDRSAFVAIGLVILSFLLMTFDIRSSSQGVAGTLRNGAQSLASPIQGVLNRVIDPIVDFADGLANLAGLREENARLRERIDELERDAVRIQALENDVTALRELLDLSLPGDLDEIGIAAEVTGRGGTLDLAFTIDKGTLDGVQVNQPVVDAGGALVGVVADASEASSSVVPITSRQAPGVVVMLEDRGRGVVTGQGTGTLELQVIAESATRVLEGDLLETFGPYESSNQYPRGLLVGTVLESATPVAGQFVVDVEPLFDLDRLQFVVVIPWPPQDATPPEPEAGEGPATSTDESTDTTDSTLPEGEGDEEGSG